MEDSILYNALITGGSGMVGSNIHFGYKPTSTEMDITSSKSIEKYISDKSVSCVIHLAALNLRESENNYTKAINVNINGTAKMLAAAMKLNVPFVLMSSGAVFASACPNIRFEENFVVCPNSNYGHTKASSEEIAMIYDKSILIRTGWLFGGNQKTHYKFVETAINNFFINKEIKASNNFFGSPTYVVDLIEHMKKLILNLKYGIHHVVNSGSASGYEIATEITKILNIDRGLVHSVSSDMVPNSGPQRSATEILDTNQEFNKLRSWKESLSEYATIYFGKLCEIKNVESIVAKQPEKKWSNRENCRLCNNYNLNVFLKLNPTPPANHFVPEPIYQDRIPLDVCICDKCKHIQLVQIVEPAYQYSNYFYVSSASPSMVTHLKTSVDSFTEFLNISKTDDYILEIGANDGVCIKHLLESGFKNVVGIDPATNINKRHELPIICDFFGSNILNDSMIQKCRPFNLIYAFHCCAHIENIQDVFKTIYSLLTGDGTFIMEVGYFYEVFKNNIFDTIYHEHIDYHTCTAMQSFAESQNLILYKVAENRIQGGSIQFFFCKQGANMSIDNSVNETIKKENSISLHKYENLASWQNKITLCGNDINYMLNSFVTYGKKIAGYGASAKSTTFLYQYNLNRKLIDYIIDDSIYKQNYYSPGLNIQIKPMSYLDTHRVDYIIILSWNFADDIIKKLEPYRKIGLRIIIPFPEIRIV
jgi:dTDP-4-dehydrorhamnose reductase/SAM-dependent methyltransferase